MSRPPLTESIISGIQQIGIGNTDVYETWKWYRQNLGMDIPVFDEAAEAALMLPYTGGKPRSRHAILALNHLGGGGAEIWQYTSRIGQKPDFQLQLGDLGIYVAKFKTNNIPAAHSQLSINNKTTQIHNSPEGKPHFFLWDQDGNVIELCESDSWFRKKKAAIGGVYGATIGVSDMDRAIHFYNSLLGYDQVVYDKQGHFTDLEDLSNNATYRRVLLRHSAPRVGPFSRMFGDSEIELIQSLDRTPKKIFDNRMWGDTGFIHLCFDIQGMDALRGKCLALNCPFTVDSGDFDMGEAAGQFAYVEDPDGTLIEFVETQKVPILKKFGWYLDLTKRNPHKALPSWMLKAMALNRVKD